MDRKNITELVKRELFYSKESLRRIAIEIEENKKELARSYNQKIRLEATIKEYESYLIEIGISPTDIKEEEN